MRRRIAINIFMAYALFSAHAALAHECIDLFYVPTRSHPSSVLETLQIMAHEALGAPAQLQIQFFDRYQEGKDNGHMWVDICFQPTAHTLAGCLKFYGLIFPQEWNYLEDRELLSKILDNSPEKDLYLEMAQLILNPQPQHPDQRPVQPNSTFYLDRTKANLKAKFKLENIELLGEPVDKGRKLLSHVLKSEQQHIGHSKFIFYDTHLEIDRIHADHDLNPGTRKYDFRKMGIGAAFIENALQAFPQTITIEASALVHDNDAAIQQPYPEGQTFAEAFLRIPSYRTLSRLGFSQIRSILIRSGGMHKPLLTPTYGFTVGRD